MLPIRPPVIVHHMAALEGSPYPPNSLEAIQACREAGAGFIEIDATALAADDYLLVHDPVLEHETSGTGEVGATSVEQVQALTIRHKDVITPYRVPLLSQVVALFLQHPGKARLQIDYKDVLPREADEALLRLIRLIEPLGERVIVSSHADWHLRKLRRLAPWLDVGFDIGFYLDYRPNGSDERKPPFRIGDYGYHDDHVLATRRLLSAARYLEERCEIMRSALPDASIWYVNYQLIVRCLQDGFNMAAWLHERGIRLDAWTLDTHRPNAAEHARLMLNAGVDQFTTNTPLALGSLLRESSTGTEG